MESESESEDEHGTLQAAIQRGGRIGKLAKAAKAVAGKVKLQAGLDEDAAEDEDDDNEARRLWGANKKSYHGADDESDDEEAAAEEGAEALRLQREQAMSFTAADYDDSHMFPDEAAGEASDGSGSDGGEEAVMDLPMGTRTVERIQRTPLDGDEARAVIERDAPELLALLAELTESLQEVRSRVGPVLQQVQGGQLATAEGLSYLEAKHLLLLSYCTHIVFYVLLKAEGAPVTTHPVISRLLQLRTTLEKLRPIDKKLAYQIDKLLAAGQKPLAASQHGEDGGDLPPPQEDALSFGPRPDQLLPRSQAGVAPSTGDANGLYRPPRLAAVAMEPQGEENGTRGSAKERRRERDASRRGGRAALMAELAQEVEGAPEEAGTAGGAIGETVADSAAARRKLHSLDARAAVEEDLMMRVPLSKDQRRSLKAHKRAALSGKGLNDDFADDVAELVAATEGVSRSERGGVPDDLFSRQRVSQKYGSDAILPPSASRGGDADVPAREPLHERRARLDGVKARQSAVRQDDDEFSGRQLPAGEEDATYQAASAAATLRKRARKEQRAVPKTLPPLPDPLVEGARAINTAIEKNRGLTPHRNKAGKNPRKKNRTKFEKATIARKGQVQPSRERSSAYGGEATGIKAKISKSRRF